MIGKYASENNGNRIIYIKYFIYILLLEEMIGIVQVINPDFAYKSIDLYVANTERYIGMFNTWTVPRAIGTIGNPNYFGALSAILIWISYFLLSEIIKKRQSKNYKYIGIFGFVFGIIGILISQSDTSTIATIIFIFIPIILKFIFNKYKKNKLLSFIIIIIILTLLIIFNKYLFDLINNIINLNELGDLNGRIGVWENLKNILEQSSIKNVFWGYGSENVKSKILWFDNFYIKLFFTSGIIVCLIYFIFLKNLINYCIKYNKKNLICLMFILFIIVIDFTAEFSSQSNLGVLLYFLLAYFTYYDYNSIELKKD
ncbi:hypothetical protein ACV3V0_13445 [Clostridium perfringens]